MTSGIDIVERIIFKEISLIMQIQSLIYYSCIILINSILLSEFCAEKK
ncbi:hypothetical protein XNW1_550002 [Xenorhabdus nematophila str. Websteri]|nr:hypothetical protein XNW1_4030002 [Xenorhabdus nematophila str. Websteri]CEF33865.1 hypothetical protein XNW1_550002 [Xenorhabdus nematophila str. Websteri]